MTEDLLDEQLLKSIRTDLREIEMNYLESQLEQLQAQTRNIMTAEQHRLLVRKISSIRVNLRQLRKLI